MNWQVVDELIKFISIVAGAYGGVWKALDVYQTKLGKDAIKEFKESLEKLKRDSDDHTEKIKANDTKTTEILGIVLSYFKR